ncbi:DNA -binding domain-containing protein [Mesorhizobium caraganae]|uniref:DNA -binding domain-containing protein n=1 Tax=Mesorhizobium caraganae TaxID=483206 RepID=UPI0028AF50BC|nr:DUF2285 domain-containing protein [Mesorhizobium caraganae]
MSLPAQIAGKDFSTMQERPAPVEHPTKYFRQTGVVEAQSKMVKARTNARNWDAACGRRRPWAESLTSYGREHFTIYLRILDACVDNASEKEMVDLILGIDPMLEPERACNVLHSHIDRANWMVTTGYKELFAG